MHLIFLRGEVTCKELIIMQFTSCRNDVYCTGIQSILLHAMTLRWITVVSWSHREDVTPRRETALLISDYAALNLPCLLCNRIIRLKFEMKSCHRLHRVNGVVVESPLFLKAPSLTSSQQRRCNRLKSFAPATFDVLTPVDVTRVQ